jgi:hypothetical protein
VLLARDHHDLEQGGDQRERQQHADERQMIGEL